MLETLNLLGGFDLRATKQNSADYAHTVVEAEKLGYADRDAYYGDPDFTRNARRATFQRVRQPPEAADGRAAGFRGAHSRRPRPHDRGPRRTLRGRGSSTATASTRTPCASM